MYGSHAQFWLVFNINGEKKINKRFTLDSGQRTQYK